MDIGKYCQLFTHELIIDQYAISAFYSPPNCPFPFDDHHQNLIHPFRARPHSTPQTASQSIYGCGHCSHVRTDRWSRRKSRSISASLIERRANKAMVYRKLRPAALVPRTRRVLAPPAVVQDTMQPTSRSRYVIPLTTSQRCC